MPESKFITYLLEQLAQNEEDRERFNSLCRIKICKMSKDWGFSSDLLPFGSFDDLIDMEKEHVIRTALSRKDGKAVLSALEGGTKERTVITIYEDEIEVLKQYGYSVNLEVNPYNYFKLEVNANGIVDNSKNHIVYHKHISQQFISDALYEAFDYPLRNGGTLDEALTALDMKMEELGIIK